MTLMHGIESFLDCCSDVSRSAGVVDEHFVDGSLPPASFVAGFNSQGASVAQR